MNKSVIVVISVLILVSLSLNEARPRHKSWHEHLLKSYEVSESGSSKICKNCNYITVGNGENNYNRIYNIPKPKSKAENTDEIYNESDKSLESDEDGKMCDGCTFTEVGNGNNNNNKIYYAKSEEIENKKRQSKRARWRSVA